MLTRRCWLTCPTLTPRPRASYRSCTRRHTPRLLVAWLPLPHRARLEAPRGDVKLHLGLGRGIDGAVTEPATRRTGTPPAAALHNGDSMPAASFRPGRQTRVVFRLFSASIGRGASAAHLLVVGINSTRGSENEARSEEGRCRTGHTEVAAWSPQHAA